MRIVWRSCKSFVTGSLIYFTQLYGLFSFEYVTCGFYYCFLPPGNESRKEFLEDTLTFWFPESLSTHFFSSF